MRIIPSTRQGLIEQEIPPNTIGAEIGVYCGAFSHQLLRHPIKKLFMIDPWQSYDEFEHDWLNTQDLTKAMADAERYNAADLAIGRAMIIRTYSASAAKKWHSYNLPLLDWVYIDANHLYKYALEDMELWSGLLAPGGFIMGHDYVEHPECGVIQAVGEFCARHGWHLDCLTANDNKGCPDWENIPSFKLIKTK